MKHKHFCFINNSLVWEEYLGQNLWYLYCIVDLKYIVNCTILYMHLLQRKNYLSISFLQNSNWLNFTDVNSSRLTLIFGKLNKGFKQKISPEFKVSHNNGLQTGLQWHWSLQTGFEARRRPNKAIAVTAKSSNSNTYHILIDCELYYLLAICRKTKDQMRKDVVKAIIQNSHSYISPVDVYFNYIFHLLSFFCFSWNIIRFLYDRRQKVLSVFGETFWQHGVCWGH